MSHYDLSKIEFKGDKKFLSNMYPCEIIFSRDLVPEGEFLNVPFDDETYASSEHLYQSLKSSSLEWKKLIQSVEIPEKTKTLARKMLKNNLLIETDTSFSIRPDWDEVKLEFMEAIVFLKFIQNQDLRVKLLTLEDTIEEKNCWGDRFWGTVDGEGFNHLGKILMLVRKKLLLMGF